MMAPTTVVMLDPCPSGLPVVLIVAHITLPVAWHATCSQWKMSMRWVELPDPPGEAWREHAANPLRWSVRLYIFQLTPAVLKNPDAWLAIACKRGSAELLEGAGDFASSR